MTLSEPQPTGDAGLARSTDASASDATAASVGSSGFDPFELGEGETDEGAPEGLLGDDAGELDDARVLQPDDEDQEPLSSESLSDPAAPRRCFEVKCEEKCRLDVYLQGRLKGISRNRVQQIIELGGVLVRGQTRPKPSTKVGRGDVLEVTLPPQRVRRIVPEDIPLDVLYEDDWFIAINKQAGLIVHPARSQLTGTLLHALAHHFQKQAQAQGLSFDGWQTQGFAPAGDPRHQRRARTTHTRGELAGEVVEGQVRGLSSVGSEFLRPGVVHRLDKYTTGVMVVAKSDAGHWGIARQFENRVPTKAYLALVHGEFDPNDGPGGVVDQPIGKHPTVREAFAVRHDSEARNALTLYRIRERYRGYTLVELELRTGRTHQIRIHLQYLGHPIIGDLVYGGNPICTGDLDQPAIPPGARRNQSFARTRDDGLAIIGAYEHRPDLLLMHPALHATYLRFLHPADHRPVEFNAPLHEPMKSILRQLRERPAPGPVATHGYHVDLNCLGL